MSSREISDAKNGITSRKEYGFRDPVVKHVVNKFVARSDIGYEKYGVTLDEDVKDIQKWLQHLQEELLDASNYVEKLKQSLSKYE